MNFSVEYWISIVAAVITLLLFIFAVDWRYFRDWVVVFLFKALLDITIAAALVKAGFFVYPFRLLTRYYDSSLLFDAWVFPVLCILYNQVTRERGIVPIVYYAVLFSAGMTIMEYVLAGTVHCVN